MFPIQQPDFDNVHTMNKQELIQKIKNAPLIYTPESQTLYSDLNFILLGWIIEKIDHVSLNSDLEKNVFQPLDMISTFYSPTHKERPSPGR